MRRSCRGRLTSLTRRSRAGQRPGGAEAHRPAAPRGQRVSVSTKNALEAFRSAQALIRHCRTEHPGAQMIGYWRSDNPLGRAGRARRPPERSVARRQPRVPGGRDRAARVPGTVCRTAVRHLGAAGARGERGTRRSPSVRDREASRGSRSRGCAHVPRSGRRTWGRGTGRDPDQGIAAGDEGTRTEADCIVQRNRATRELE